MTMLAITALVLLGSARGAQEQAPRRTPPPVPRPLRVYNVSLLLIGRNVDDADPADQQVGWGLEYDARSRRNILGWEVGVTRTSDEESVAGGGEFEATLVEIYTGARKTWGAPGDLHPYLGAGLSWVDAEGTLSGGGSEDDSSFGLYAHGGAYWTFGKHFNLGADLRALVGTDIEFGDANYVQAAVTLGYSI
jgi:hypothetical protein